MDIAKKCAAAIKHCLVYCPICLEVVTEPVLLKCNHCFCDTCLKKYLQMQTTNNKKNTCPNCNKVFNRRAVYKAPALNCTVFQDFLAYLQNETGIDVSNIQPIEPPLTQYPPERYKISQDKSNLIEKTRFKRHKSSTKITKSSCTDEIKTNTKDNQVIKEDNNLNHFNLKDVTVQLSPLKPVVIAGLKRKNDSDEVKTGNDGACKKKLRSEYSENAGCSKQMKRSHSIPLKEVKNNILSIADTSNTANKVNNIDSSCSSYSSISSFHYIDKYKTQSSQNLQRSLEKVENWLSQQCEPEHMSQNSNPPFKRSKSLTPFKTTPRTKMRKRNASCTSIGATAHTIDSNKNHKINDILKILETNCLNSLQEKKKNDWNRVKKELRTPQFKKLNVYTRKPTTTSGKTPSNPVRNIDFEQNLHSTDEIDRFVWLIDKISNELINVHNILDNTTILNNLKNYAQELRKKIKIIDFKKLQNKTITIDKCTNTDILKVTCPQCQHHFCIDHFNQSGDVNDVNVTNLPFSNLSNLELTQKINQSRDIIQSEDVIRGTEQEPRRFKNRFFKNKPQRFEKAKSAQHGEKKQNSQNKKHLSKIENIDLNGICDSSSVSDEIEDVIASTPQHKNKKRLTKSLMSRSDSNGSVESDSEYLSVIPPTKITHPKKSKIIRKNEKDMKDRLDISLIEPIRTQTPVSLPVKELTPPPGFADIQTQVNHKKSVLDNNYSVLPETTMVKMVKTPKLKNSIDKLKQAPILINFQPTTEKSQIESSFCIPRTKSRIQQQREHASSRKSDTNDQKIVEISDSDGNLSMSSDQETTVLKVTKKQGSRVIHSGPSNDSFKQTSVLNYLNQSKSNTQDQSQSIPKTPSYGNKNTSLMFTPISQNWKNLPASTPKPSTPFTPSTRIVTAQKKNIELIFTRLSTTEITVLTNFCKQFNIAYSSKIGNTATHLVTQVNAENVIEDLTVKYVCAVARGLWVVSFKWIEDCLAENKLLPEEQYEVLDPEETCGPKNSRLDRKPSQLLENFHIHIISDPSLFPLEELQYCLRINGAQIHPTLESLVNNEQGIPLLVAEVSGDSEELVNIYQEYYDRYGIITVTNEWIYQSIGRYKVDSLAKYLLCCINGTPQKYPLYLLSETQTETL